MSSESASSAGNRADAEHPPGSPAWRGHGVHTPSSTSVHHGLCCARSSEGCPETPPGRYCTFRPQRRSGIHPQAGWLRDGTPGSYVQQGNLPDHEGRCQLLWPLRPGLPAHTPVALAPTGHQHGAGPGPPGPPASAWGCAGQAQEVLGETLLWPGLQGAGALGWGRGPGRGGNVAALGDGAR